MSSTTEAEPTHMHSKVATTPRGNNSTGVEPNIDQGHNLTMAKKPTLDEMRLALSKGKTKHEHAHDKARLNAIKMLGLHEHNTAEDRAKAMGFDLETFHGTDAPDIESLDPERTKIIKGVFSTTNPKTASRYAEDERKRAQEKTAPNVLPLLIKSASHEIIPKYDINTINAYKNRGAKGVYRPEMQTAVTFDPSHIRSRFAAFDPEKEHDTDLLAAKGGEVHMAEGGSDDDYRGSHQAPGPHFGAPMHDVSGNGMYPEDFYGPNGAHYYGNINDPIDREAHRQVLSVKGKPDAMVTIHRAIPTHVHEAAMKTEDPIKHMIRHGDWVAIHKGYAKIHGEGPLKGKYKIASMRVPAKHVWTNADSIHEWGYHPEEKTVAKAKGGVTHAHHLEIEERPL